MKKTLLTGVTLMACCTVYAGGESQWGYAGEDGPENWAELSPDFAACHGKNQSPINLTEFIEAELAPIDLDYRPGGSEILNNGHTIQVNYTPGSGSVVDGNRFELKQFHFHSPSENIIDGISYAMEAHLVHADKDGNLAVIAVMFVEGDENKTLAKAWPYLPKNAGDKRALSPPVTAEDLLPVNRDYYRFNGSLTTPPCSEGVLWLVMKQPVSASMLQIRAFVDLMHYPNNRPVQPTNARAVLE